MMIYPRIAIVGIALISACAFGAPPRGPGHETATAANSFALDLFAQMTNRSENITFSPFGIHMVMAMAREGAKGNTRAEMDKTLLVSEELKLAENYKRLLDGIRTVVTNGQSELRIGTSVWSQKGLRIEKDFSGTVQDSYYSSIMETDFNKLPQQAAVNINAWVSKKTNYRIKKVADRDAFTKETLAALVSAVYFKGVWIDPFKYGRTATGSFLLPDGTKTDVYYMHQTERLDYGFDEHVELLSKKYVGGDLEMMFVVPRKAGIFTKEGEKITTKKIERWISLLRTRETEVYIPKFKFETMLDCTDMLKLMGMTEAFDPTKADFTGISKAFYLEKVIHAAEIEVEERGTTASAATLSPAAAGASPRPPPTFAADKPFIFIIRERATGLILFMGYVADPNKR